jgi:hypothetical protein
MNISSINFEAANDEPELRDASDAIKTWLRKHPNLKFFTFDQIRRDLGSKVSPEKLNRVLLRLVSVGELKVHYRVRFANGGYSERRFKNYSGIPARIQNNDLVFVDVKDDDKVVAYTNAK